MTNNKCRLCDSKLFTDPLLQLHGMPKAAQHFPNKNEFKNDKKILLAIFQCTACGLVQLNIDPVSYFREVITAASFSEEAKISRLNQMKKFITQFKLNKKKVLEVGSGKGNMLDILEEAGAKAFGVEASKESAQIAKAAGRNMINSYIGDIEKVDGHTFDAFISLN